MFAQSSACSHVTDYVAVCETGVGGHSWGGYLTLMCMCAPVAAGVFSCGMAGAAISDLNIQLRQTELRAYDRQILGD